MGTAITNLPVQGNNALQVVSGSLAQSNRESQSFEKTTRSTSDLYHQQRFAHHGLTFYIETEGWPDENAARFAVAALRNWVTQLGSAETTNLFVVLLRERAAIVQELEFDHQQAPLPTVRSAQRHAVRTTMNGKNDKDQPWPLLILEAGVL